MQDKWVLTKQGVWATAVFVTLLALLENTVAPWTPFFVVTMVVMVLAPLLWRSYRFGRLRDVRWWQWPAGVVAAVLLQILGGLFLTGLLPLLFGGSSMSTDISLALPAMFAEAATLWNTTPQTMQFAYLGFILLGAGVSEELFYRGYLHGTLKGHYGLATAVVGSAVFFGVRHATQLALLWPDYPFAAAAGWVLFSFGFGVAMSILYERTRSLYLPIFIHILFNLIAFAGASGA